jgi:dephospho-CoA kinase
MFKVGLTGNYYSGQQEVAKIFEDFDVPVFDANLIIKFMINFSPRHIEKIKEKFGDDIYKFGLLNLNRFHTNKKFDDLLDILEFDLLKAYEKFRLDHKTDFYTIFLFDWIYERNLNSLMNFNVSSYRPQVHRKSDLKYWANLNSMEVQKILDNEVDEFEKNKSDIKAEPSKQYPHPYQHMI